ncbi:ribosomal protein S18 acetylase RimI-like enzyme [Bradyrhizobium huanghuaihaiense]|uniref:Acetyltransferase (GNAT) family protein n=1 Tax=Bradyrhizobium huanghuaihaiense TaxID=990078 RepID=A0A562RI47_9BRAD|nr:GNAT family N-acetyltransferase [Bradyrhizobium huanghuaihaiense]TWI68769.1 acetyltransferase (GNAT) family protein [Bradyrhizobium huanghuaihaiense]
MTDGISLDIVPDDPALRLRCDGPIDAPFIRHLFEEVRTAQFTATGLSGPIVRQLIAQQFRSQLAGYATQFPGAISLIVTRDGTAIGRLLLHCARERWHIVDIALLPADCGRGAGTKIVEALGADARRQGVSALTLTVLAGNQAARRFYQRHGFAETGMLGAAHLAMRKDLAA